jgi:hypothetical protein
MIRRLLLLVAGLALVAAACGDSGSAPASDAPASALQDAPPADSPPADTTPPATVGADTIPADTAPADDDDPMGGAQDPPAPTAPAAVTTDYDGPEAPDFSLPLQNVDAVYTLSAEQDPVYMVFWAEW